VAPSMDADEDIVRCCGGCAIAPFRCFLEITGGATTSMGIQPFDRLTPCCIA